MKVERRKHTDLLSQLSYLEIATNQSYNECWDQFNDALSVERLRDVITDVFKNMKSLKHGMISEQIAIEIRRECGLKEPGDEK